MPTILGNIENFEPGAGERRFEQGRQEAQKKEQELLERSGSFRTGIGKADEVKRMIDRVRTFSGYREYRSTGMVSRYFVYKQALLDEAERLVQAGVLREQEDIFFLTFGELHDVVRTNQVDDLLIQQRKDAFRSVSSADAARCSRRTARSSPGRTDATTCHPGRWSVCRSPPASSRRARVILDIAQADLEAGDILVMAYTDPSWSPCSSRSTAW